MNERHEHSVWVMMMMEMYWVMMMSICGLCEIICLLFPDKIQLLDGDAHILVFRIYDWGQRRIVRKQNKNCRQHGSTSQTYYFVIM